MNRYNKFDEVFYLTNNPDVAKAVIFGGLKSGEEHYLLNGRRRSTICSLKLPTENPAT